MESGELNNRFQHHPPTGDKVQAHETVRGTLLQVAAGLDNLLPEGREKALFFTKIEEAMFWANAAIARKGSGNANGK